MGLDRAVGLYLGVRGSELPDHAAQDGLQWVWRRAPALAAQLAACEVEDLVDEARHPMEGSLASNRSCASAWNLEALSPPCMSASTEASGLRGSPQHRDELTAQRSSHLSSAMLSNASPPTGQVSARRSASYSLDDDDVREFEGVVSSPPLVRSEYGQLLRRAGHHIHRDLPERPMHALGGVGLEDNAPWKIDASVIYRCKSQLSVSRYRLPRFYPIGGWMPHSVRRSIIC